MSGTCGTARRPSPSPCNIRAEVRNRNGHLRWWCDVHGAPAWGPSGERLPRCPGADASPTDPEDVVRLDPRDFPGGIGIWGALSPVYNSGPIITDWGVHVHARDAPGGPKVIDRTFALVQLVLDDRVVEIDAASAAAAVVARTFAFDLKTLSCPHCRELHLDREEFAGTPHRKHQCNRCGRAFFDPDGEPSISNPLADLRSTAAAPQASALHLVLAQSEYPGGLAIWGSNPALFWTVDKPETEGLHVHAWTETGEVTIDETFHSVAIDGVGLDPHMLRVLMVQQSLAFLRERVISSDCRSCHSPLFDDGPLALMPKTEHVCVRCGSRVTTAGRRKLVFNPMVAVLERLAGGASRRRENPAA